VALSSGTVLFFENFHGHLVFEGRSCVNGLSVQGRFFVTQAATHVLMFGASLAICFATWRGLFAQSGCLSCGSLLTYQQRQSAIRHRPGGLSVLKAASSSCHHAIKTQGAAQKYSGSVANRWLQMARGLSFGRREAKVFFARLTSRGRISENKVHRHATAGNQSCNCQTSRTALRFACSQRPLLRAPA
jgi:hypothetical protein